MNKEDKTSKNVQCLECKNNIALSESDIKPGYFFECPFCGITMEVKEVNPNGEVHITIVELEK